MTSDQQNTLIFIALSIAVLTIVSAVLWIERGAGFVLAATAILAIWLAEWFGVERFIRGSSPANLGTFVKLTLVGTLIG